MKNNTKIEWTHVPGYKGESLNCVTGCTKCSFGCRSCYAERMTKRLQAMYQAKIVSGEPFRGVNKYEAGFNKVVIHCRAWQPVSRWTARRSVFLNSMSDTFHEDVPWWYISWMFGNMNKYDKHIWQVLTKRSERMLDVCNFQGVGIKFTPNIWMGVTVEHKEYIHRIEHLRAMRAKVKFLSLEPLLSPLSDLDLEGIHWVIVGGETGAGAREMNPDWARGIKEQCKEQGVAFFMKQMSKKQPIPHDLILREFPEVI